MREFFQRRGKFRPRNVEEDGAELQIPEHLWVKCPRCQELVYSKELDRNARVCPTCNYHFRLRARDRISSLVDQGSFVEWDAGLRPHDQLGFVDLAGTYEAKLRQTVAKSGEPEALITGCGTIQRRQLALAVCDFEFLGGSMGSVFGEKLVRAAERCAEQQLPLLTISTSGGARMHEGMVSLMQMAKTVAALARLGRARMPHFALLADPCYGGVTASYATIADVILAEPGAMIGFAGPRVIEQITKQNLPEGFQTAEFLCEHGMVDIIVPRPELRSTIVELADHYGPHRPLAPANGVAGPADPLAQVPVAGIGRHDD